MERPSTVKLSAVAFNRLINVTSQKTAFAASDCVSECGVGRQTFVRIIKCLFINIPFEGLATIISFLATIAVCVSSLEEPTLWLQKVRIRFICYSAYGMVY